MIDTKELTIDDISKIQRPTLGNTLPIPVFRILRVIALPAILENSAGPMLYSSGKFIGSQLELETVEELLKIIEDYGIGVAKILEQAEQKIVVQVDECASCSGLPNVGQFICDFEGGFISGALEKILRKRITTTEVKCWANGDETCVFECIVY